MKRVDVAYVLLYDDKNRRILMVKNKGKSSSSFYTLPGGAVENGETLEQAAIREVKEETGLEVSVTGINSVSEAFLEERGHHVIFFTFIGRITGGKQQILLPEEIEEITWMDAESAAQYLHLSEGQLEWSNEIPYMLRRN